MEREAIVNPDETVLSPGRENLEEVAAGQGGEVNLEIVGVEADRGKEVDLERIAGLDPEDEEAVPGNIIVDLVNVKAGVESVEAEVGVDLNIKEVVQDLCQHPILTKGPRKKVHLKRQVQSNKKLQVLQGMTLFRNISVIFIIFNVIFLF